MFALTTTLLGVALIATGGMLLFSNRWGKYAYSPGPARSLTAALVIVAGGALLLPAWNDSNELLNADPNKWLEQNPPSAGGSPITPSFNLPYKRIVVLGWGTPSDADTADSQAVEQFSQGLTKMAGLIVQAHAPKAATQVIPLTRAEYLQLRDAPLSLLGWCEQYQADFLVAIGLGSTLTNGGADYALWREPVYELLDCQTDQAARRIGRVNERRGDHFPYQIAVQQDLNQMLSRFGQRE